MIPLIVEGDSLAVQMQPALTADAPARWYDAQSARLTGAGVDRLIVRAVMVPGDLRGRPVLVSLGTADYLFGTATPQSIARDARRLLRVADCVVWKLIRVARGPWGDTGDGGAALNRGLRGVKRLHLVRAVRPDAGDGLHFTADAARRQAHRMLRVARYSC